MVAPAKINYAEKGYALLEVASVGGESTVISAYASTPLKLLTPRARGASVWAFTSSFGGGLVAGDRTRLELHLARNTRSFLGTQSATKVYRNTGQGTSSHATSAMLAEGSLLVFAPDPVQPFAHSSYGQRQEFRLAAGSGLALVDWFSSGRLACGERWAFTRLESRNEIFLEGERIFLDAVSLNPAGMPPAASHTTGRFNCFALLLLAGEPLKNAAADLLAEVAALPVQRAAPLICSASPIRQGAVLRVAGETTEAVGRELHRRLKFASDILGDDPWARKW
ncbi:MAG: urease accessory protein UreD [Verrucomicrobiota bacterium]